MSQKTNPLSLRLESKNQNFCSPWFTDFFFTDNIRYELQVEKYIKALLKENLYSNAFFSAKSYYRKFNFLIAIQDTRALRKEKQMLFNIKSFLVPNKNSNGLDLSKESRGLQTIKKSNKITEYKNLSFRENTILSDIFECNSVSRTGSILENTNHNCTQDFKYSIRKKVINNFLKIKQSYNLQCVNSLESRVSFISNNLFKNKIKDRDFLFFSQQIISKKVRIPILSGFNENNFIDIKPSFSNSLKALRKNQVNFSTGISSIQPIRFINYTQNVVSLLDLIAFLLEKRVSFTRVKSKILKDISRNSNIKGVRISCSGRLGGRSKKAQKAKTQSYQWGETCLNTFSSKVTFANKSITTSYGKIGIKLWISFI